MRPTAGIDELRSALLRATSYASRASVAVVLLVFLPFLLPQQPSPPFGQFFQPFSLSSQLPSLLLGKLRSLSIVILPRASAVQTPDEVTVCPQGLLLVLQLLQLFAGHFVTFFALLNLSLLSSPATSLLLLATLKAARPIVHDLVLVFLLVQPRVEAVLALGIVGLDGPDQIGGQLVLFQPPRRIREHGPEQIKD